MDVVHRVDSRRCGPACQVHGRDRHRSRRKDSSRHRPDVSANRSRRDRPHVAPPRSDHHYQTFTRGVASDQVALARLAPRSHAWCPTFHQARFMSPDTATVANGYTVAKSAKHSFLERYERNHATTVKVLNAFPGERSEF